MVVRACLCVCLCVCAQGSEAKRASHSHCVSGRMRERAIDSNGVTELLLVCVFMLSGVCVCVQVAASLLGHCSLQ